MHQTPGIKSKMITDANLLIVGLKQTRIITGITKQDNSTYGRPPPSWVSPPPSSVEWTFNRRMDKHGSNVGNCRMANWARAQGLMCCLHCTNRHMAGTCHEIMGQSLQDSKTDVGNHLEHGEGIGGRFAKAGGPPVSRSLVHHAMLQQRCYGRAECLHRLLVCCMFSTSIGQAQIQQACTCLLIFFSSSKVL